MSPLSEYPGQKAPKEQQNAAHGVSRGSKSISDASPKRAKETMRKKQWRSFVPQIV